MPKFDPHDPMFLNFLTENQEVLPLIIPLIMKLILKLFIYQNSLQARVSGFLIA